MYEINIYLLAKRPFNRTLNVNFGNDFQAVLKYNGNIIVSITLT